LSKVFEAVVIVFLDTVARVDVETAVMPLAHLLGLPGQITSPS
jgi:hypothetical protein